MYLCYMKKNKELDFKLLDSLYLQNISYADIARMTGYNQNSVKSYFYRTGRRRKEGLQTIPLTQFQKEVLFGTLMGDGHLRQISTNSFNGRITHSLEQEFYLLHLHKIFNNMVSDISYSSIKNNDKIYYKCQFEFSCNTELIPFYQMFYKDDNKRDVPENLSLLTPLAMAYWFMDDGYASSGCSINIATCGFSNNGLDRLKSFLKKTYDLNITITKDKRFYFKAESGRKFYYLTKDYVLSEMQYKFRALNLSK